MSSLHRIYSRVSPYFRSRRMQGFLEVFKPTRDTRILDVGGFPQTWQSVPIESKVTILNIHAIEGSWPDRFQIVIGDGTKLAYPDASFDIVFSNSVIEHLGNSSAQVAFAKELRRVGKGYWVQTPARSFPIEPHYLAPLIHYLPKKWQRALVRHFTLWGHFNKPTPSEVNSMVEEIRLLGRNEIQELFPDGSILTERFAGLAKSYTVYRNEIGKDPPSR